MLWRDVFGRTYLQLCLAKTATSAESLPGLNAALGAAHVSSQVRRRPGLLCLQPGSVERNRNIIPGCCEA
jgi:hypothetical protein